MYVCMYVPVRRDGLLVLERVGQQGHGVWVLSAVVYVKIIRQRDRDVLVLQLKHLLPLARTAVVLVEISKRRAAAGLVAAPNV